MDVGANVEQNKEVDTTPGAQEGQDRWRWRRDKGGVGGVDRGVEGEEGEAAVQKSFFSSSGVTEGGKESYSCPPLLVLRIGLETKTQSVIY